MKIFELTRTLPKEEIYSPTDQIRRYSSSVCANLAEAWRKRRYEAAFIAKLTDAETQVWLEFAVNCDYLKRSEAAALYQSCDVAIATIVGVITYPRTWIIAKEAR